MRTVINWWFTHTLLNIVEPWDYGVLLYVANPFSEDVLFKEVTNDFTLKFSFTLILFYYNAYVSINYPINAWALLVPNCFTILINIVDLEIMMYFYMWLPLFRRCIFQRGD